jgi:hypothetical protein
MNEGVAETSRWAQGLFGHCELGDKRRTRRLVKVASALAAHTGRSVLRACDGDKAASEGAYRLIRNDAVSAQAIAEGGFEATARLARGHETLLAVEDSTSLSYGHSVSEELGPTNSRREAKARGLMVHSVLLLDADGERTLGLIEQQRWCRDAATHGKKHRRKQRAYEDKESAKWERASRHLEQRLGAEVMARVISVCDREADIYEYLRFKCGQRYVVRAAWNRRTQDERARLFEQLAVAPVLGEHEVEVAQRGGPAGRKARRARLEVRCMAVTLRAPKRDESLGPVTVNALYAYEAQPAGDGQACVEWMLLTSEPVQTLEQAHRVLRYYALRWRIEEFHKAWKSGTGVEQQRMHSAENLERAVVMLAFVAVRLLQLREALLDDEERSRQPCTEVLTEAEWKVLWLTRTRQRPPEQPPSLKWAYEAIARLGGWTDTKRTGRASWDTVWDGWFRLQDRVDGYLAAQTLPSP